MNMDWSLIVVAFLSLIGTLVGSYLSNNKHSALIAYRLQQLEEKVEKHNKLVERIYMLEHDVAIVNARIEALGEEMHADKSD